MEFSDTTALVTGASSGIGAEFARQLARRGADVVVVARRREELELLAAALRAETGRTIQVRPADLSEPGSGTQLQQDLASAGVQVDTVINCAGVAVTSAFAEADLGDLQRQIAVNVDAVVELSHAFLPQLLSSARGALVNVGSLTGYVPVPNMAVYAATKSFVIRFTEALAYEQRESALSIMSVSPGPTRSEFFASSGTDGSRTRFQAPDEVVSQALRALVRPKAPKSLITGAGNRWARRLLDILPRTWAMRLAETQPTGRR